MLQDFENPTLPVRSLELAFPNSVYPLIFEPVGRGKSADVASRAGPGRSGPIYDSFLAVTSKREFTANSRKPFRSGSFSPCVGLAVHPVPDRRRSRGRKWRRIPAKPRFGGVAADSRLRIPRRSRFDLGFLA